MSIYLYMFIYVCVHIYMKHTYIHYFNHFMCSNCRLPLFCHSLEAKQRQSQDRSFNYECCFNMCNVLFFLPLQSLEAVLFPILSAYRVKETTNSCHTWWRRSEVMAALDLMLPRWRCSWTENQVHQSRPPRPLTWCTSPGSNLHPPRPLRLVLSNGGESQSLQPLGSRKDWVSIHHRLLCTSAVFQWSSGAI